MKSKTKKMMGAGRRHWMWILRDIGISGAVFLYSVSPRIMETKQIKT